MLLFVFFKKIITLVEKINFFKFFFWKFETRFNCYLQNRVQKHHGSTCFKMTLKLHNLVDYNFFL